jgi:hypothetical protein
MRIIYILPILALVGCNSTNPVITTTTLKVVQPPASLYVCPSVKTWPNPDKLTDVQVGRLIVQLNSNNLKCKSSLDSIKSFLDKADKTSN